MENKYLKYILIGLAVIVWGAIVYRVGDGLKGNAAPPATLIDPVHTTSPNRNDTFIIYADYPDPFIAEPDTLDTMDPKKILHSSGSVGANGAPGSIGIIPTEPTLSMVQSFIQYSGMISNPKKKLKIAIIILHGKEILIKEKEKRDDILVKKIENEKIGIIYQGKYFSIYKP